MGLDQKDARIVPNMGVRVAFLQKQDKAGAKPDALSCQRAVLLAPSSVVERDGKKVVPTIVDGRAAQRESSPPANHQQQDRHPGLKAGDTVIDNPPETLRDGMAVVVEWPLNLPFNHAAEPAGGPGQAQRRLHQRGRGAH